MGSAKDEDEILCSHVITENIYNFYLAKTIFISPWYVKVSIIVYYLNQEAEQKKDNSFQI